MSINIQMNIFGDDKIEQERIRDQIIADNSQSFRECVGSYLKIFAKLPTYSSAFQNFLVVLKERGLYVEKDIDNLRFTLATAKFDEPDEPIESVLITVRDTATLEKEKFAEEVRKRLNKFYDSSSYRYIKQFAKKFGEKATQGDLDQLRVLLENWQWEFSVEELQGFIIAEVREQKLANLKSKIFADNPYNRGAILKTYLNFYRANDVGGLETLAALLEEKYSLSVNLIDLENELITIEKRNELDNFEKRLLEEDPQMFLEDVDRLSGYEFEDFLKTLFSKMGYQVERTRLSGDQGADLIVIKFGEKKVVQAKRFGGKVGNYAVQEIMAAISLYRADVGMVITNNHFTTSAIELAHANSIELIDRDGLEEMINKHW